MISALAPGNVDCYDAVGAMCRARFHDFVRTFWEEVPGAGQVIWGWHMDVLCEELQHIAEQVFVGRPKAYDVIFNVSPGTSKSTICSILFPAWLWTRMPQARILTGSHTDDLVLDLANKARYVIKSELYRSCFPDIAMRADQDTKSYYANTKGGDRYTCTVGGKSPMGFHAHFIIIDDPIDPKKAVSEAELKAAKEFFDAVLPSRKVDKSVTVSFLIMQRLHTEDPSGYLLEKSKREGAAKIKHYCLPAELARGDDGAFLPGNVAPAELAPRYVNGLMDPQRLPLSVLKERRTDGAYSFAGQYLQAPFPPGGGMFKDIFFNQRVRAAPYQAKRVRYWDRASTQDGGCYTAGVLLARDAQGSYYVEHVVHGQWEPDERNEVMRAAAERDRLRYGPHCEPVIWTEAEGGSSGRDAMKGVARALAGFPVREHRATGKKEVRAEPWASQLAAKNVYLVADGSWDVEGYIKEHVAFPLGKYKDQVDSSSGAFAQLVGPLQISTLRTYTLGRGSRRPQLRLVLCSEKELGTLLLEQPALLVALTDPPTKEVIDVNLSSSSLQGETPVVVGTNWASGVPPPPVLHGMTKLLGRHELVFADLDPADFQERFGEKVAPYGVTVDQLVLTKDRVKRLWSFLLRQWPVQPAVWVIQADTPPKALSVSYAISDALRLPRSSTIYRVGHEDWHARPEDVPPNRFVFDLVRQGRQFVVN